MSGVREGFCQVLQPHAAHAAAHWRTPAQVHRLRLRIHTEVGPATAHHNAQQRDEVRVPEVRKAVQDQEEPPVPCRNPLDRTSFQMRAMRQELQAAALAKLPREAAHEAKAVQMRPVQQGIHHQAVTQGTSPDSRSRERQEAGSGGEDPKLVRAHRDQDGTDFRGADDAHQERAPR